MKQILRLTGIVLLCFAVGLGISALIAPTMNVNSKAESGYIGPSDISIADGVMTPEALLAMGRLTDPQLSPDGSRILYGVSYTSIEENRSCRNLFLINPDGSGKVQLTRYAKSVSNARWSNDGKSIWFIQGGQLEGSAERQQARQEGPGQRCPCRNKRIQALP